MKNNMREHLFNNNLKNELFIINNNKMNINILVLINFILIIFLFLYFKY